MFFKIKKREEKSYIIDQIFLLACFQMKIFLEIFFFSINYIKIEFQSFELCLQKSSLLEVILTSEKVELI